MARLADSFEGAVGEIIETVSSAATELEASAGTLTSTAERAGEVATTVAAASEEASTNVQSVASATEELSSSVNEISRRVQESARMANEAVHQARKTNERVSELSKAASRILEVFSLHGYDGRLNASAFSPISTRRRSASRRDTPPFSVAHISMSATVPGSSVAGTVSLYFVPGGRPRSFLYPIFEGVDPDMKSPVPRPIHRSEPGSCRLHAQST